MGKYDKYFVSGLNPGEKEGSGKTIAHIDGDTFEGAIEYWVHWAFEKPRNIPGWDEWDDITHAPHVHKHPEVVALLGTDPNDPLDVLAKVGGFEIGAIAGVIFAAAARRIPVLVDGFISTAGALIAAALSPLSRDYMIAAHRSVEPGHQIMQDHLDLQPIFHLDLRLGEGTGSALAMPVVAAATATLNEMATFAEARVSGKR